MQYSGSQVPINQGAADKYSGQNHFFLAEAVSVLAPQIFGQVKLEGPDREHQKGG